MVVATAATAKADEAEAEAVVVFVVFVVFVGGRVMTVEAVTESEQCWRLQCFRGAAWM